MENWDSVTAPALPPGWFATNFGGDGTWETTPFVSESQPNNAFVPDQDGVSDKVLIRYGVNVIDTNATLSFRNNFNTEMSGGIFWDGYVLEVSAPNISNGDFLDITDSAIGGIFVSGGYTGVIDDMCLESDTTSDAVSLALPHRCNPIAGRMAWSGNSNGYINTVINLGPNLAGQTVTFRFRMCTDEVVAAPGVHIDNLVFTGATCP